MKFVFIMVAFSLTIVSAACSNQSEPEDPTPVPSAVASVEAVTPLPTAVPPDSTTGGGYAVTFRYEFPDGHWHLGDHSYGFLIECPELAYDFSTEWLIFKVTEEVDLLNFPLYLRLNGVSIEPYAPSYMQDFVIHPDQATAAVVHLVGLSEEQAELAQNECEMLIAWDQSSPKSMEADDVFKP